MELFNTISIVRRLEFDTNSEPLKVCQHDTIVKYRILLFRHNAVIQK